MKSDLTHLTFLPEDQFAAKHYGRVLLQQGRPLTDADFNEQAATLFRTLRQAVADLTGPHAGASAADFNIVPSITGTDLSSLQIDPGRYYIDGLLCEQVLAPGATPINFLTQ